MFFYVDESGHTGSNLFDPEQPVLYYGVLSSKVNIDLLGADGIAAMCREAGVPRLHAAELGVTRLAALVPRILYIQKKLDLRFDIYRIKKPDHAIICFFDQVFDQGLNPAVTWTGYWTPIRYLLLIKLAALFDENLAKKAWAARIEHRDEIAIPLFQEACNELLTRVSMLPDHRSRVLISDALHWAQENPNEIHFHAYSPNMAIDVSPNVVGFQSVMSGIARRIRQRGGKAKEIVVDQQSQFNQAQKRLAKWYADARTVQGIVNGPGLPRLDFRDMPSIQLLIKDSKASPGLSLVDIYLWIHRRFLEGKPLAPELHHIISINAARTTTDEMSLNAIDRRWSRWFDQLPDPSPEAVAKAAELHREEEEHRLKAVRTLS